MSLTYITDWMYHPANNYSYLLTRCKNYLLFVGCICSNLIVLPDNGDTSRCNVDHDCEQTSVRSTLSCIFIHIIFHPIWNSFTSPRLYTVVIFECQNVRLPEY